MAGELQSFIKSEARRLQFAMAAFINVPSIEIDGNTITVRECYRITYEVFLDPDTGRRDIGATDIKIFHKNVWGRFVVDNKYSPSLEIALSWAAGEYRRAAGLTDV